MTDRQDTADYIAALTRQLAIMAKQQRLTVLAYLLAMAELQAGLDMNPRG